jgi:hypothetical protein
MSRQKIDMSLPFLILAMFGIAMFPAALLAWLGAPMWACVLASWVTSAAGFWNASR